MATKTCTCGHSRYAHDHYRLGSDCAYRHQCGCWRFRRSRWWRRVRRAA